MRRHVFQGFCGFPCYELVVYFCWRPAGVIISRAAFPHLRKRGCISSVVAGGIGLSVVSLQASSSIVPPSPITARGCILRKLRVVGMVGGTASISLWALAEAIQAGGFHYSVSLHGAVSRMGCLWWGLFQHVAGFVIHSAAVSHHRTGGVPFCKLLFGGMVVHYIISLWALAEQNKLGGSLQRFVAWCHFLNGLLLVGLDSQCVDLH